MHVPADPADVPPEPAGTAGYEDAFEMVTRVIGWYRERILEETRAAEPNTRLLARLKTERQACAADRRVLETADPERVATIAAAYEARWRELTHRRE
ncbi:hypothetical protein [Embleya scabrispora]|uniref:hypothetical protein n=1 Tax=Embleya scabrispora TaxID=159449 RepID=UPI0003673CED|nr:hypothetical protein [Embleya scabrispora]MYS86458.1 hypothetical protein [Streptomyces sp. SID5474]